MHCIWIAFGGAKEEQNQFSVSMFGIVVFCKIVQIVCKLNAKIRCECLAQKKRIAFALSAASWPIEGKITLLQVMQSKCAKRFH